MTDLPADIEEVWGQGRLNAHGQLAADTAAFLIAEWGEDNFRMSAVHLLAREEHRRIQNKAGENWRNRDLKAFKDKP